MGYTHYWTVSASVNVGAYRAALADIRTIVRANAVILANGAGDPGTEPKLYAGVTFNGIGDSAHETFWLPSSSKNAARDFCKTAGKPYDAVVVACLSRLAEVDGVAVSSDGRASDWVEGRALAEAALGRPVACPLSAAVVAQAMAARVKQPEPIHVDFTIDRIDFTRSGYSDVERKEVKLATVTVRLSAERWLKLKKGKGLGGLYGVDISNAVYKADPRIMAYCPTVDDCQRASKGLKTIRLTYPTSISAHETPTKLRLV